MHALFITDNFPPEGNAPATRTYEHVREWVGAGHKVTIITCAPNFPDGKVFDGYKNKWFVKEYIEGIEVWRVKTYITANEGFLKRSIDFISFMLSSFLFGLFSKKVDVVIGTSPQFFTVISAWALAKIKHVPFVFELRDIWPASITAVGAMKNSKVIAALEKIELFLYAQADLIVSVTHSFKDELVQRGIDAKKITVVLNGVDLNQYQPRKNPVSEFTALYELEGKFVAGYVGTLGLAHALETIVDASFHLKDDDDIRIVIAGNGAARSRVEQLVEDRGLDNIVMIPRQPKAKMPELWRLCDVSMINLRNTPLFKTVIPSKIFEAMAMGIPMVVAVPAGEATQIIRETNTGVIVPPENAAALAEAIKSLKNRELHEQYRYSCQVAAIQFDRKKLALRMLDTIEKLLGDNR